jgi:hypothetical protein
VKGVGTLIGGWSNEPCPHPTPPPTTAGEAERNAQKEITLGDEVDKGTK